MIYIYAGIGCLIIVALQFLATADLRRLYGRLSAGREQAERARLKREQLKARESRARLEKDEAVRRVQSLQEEIMSLSREMDAVQDVIPPVTTSTGTENLRQGLEFRRALRGGRRRT